MKNITRIFDVSGYQLDNFPQDFSIAVKRTRKSFTFSTQEYLGKANFTSKDRLKKGN